MDNKVIIGTRGSKLALWQAYFTKDKLEAAGYEVTINIIKTRGDQIQHLSFDKLEGKGFFTKEIEEALLNIEVDLAVHSCKDLPTESPEGLTLTAYSARAAAHDVLLIRKEGHDGKLELELKANAVVGTSSARRKAQIMSFRPDIELKDIRGNVPTRINKLREGQFDAILLAAAGLNRLELDTSDLVRIDFNPTMFVPASAQGILAYQIRTDDERMAKIASVLDDEDSQDIINIERKILNAFQGGCQIPLGVYAKKENGIFNCWVSEAKSWDQMPVRMRFTFESKIDAPAIVQKFINLTSKSVFISKNIGSNDYFKRSLEASQYQVVGESFIDFKALPFQTDLTKYDWIFFCSKNGVKYFFDQVQTLPKSLKIAAINKGSAQVLKALGHTVDFIGEGGSLEEIAKQFDQAEGEKALIIRAKISNRSIQKNVQIKKVEDLIVYDNFIQSEIAERNEDVLVFTSPMNVEGYFSKHPLKENQTIVSIGPTTSKKIKSYGYAAKEAYEPTMWALVDEVFSY
ncbi:MAG: hydroxymethylbilane synthase [Chitinophagales bacterium]